MIAVAQEQDDLCQVRVSTTPPGAIVSFDRVMKDTAPLLLGDLPSGEHMVSANKIGYEEARKTIVLDPGQRMAVELKLRPVLALVLVHSDPTGAEIEIDGAARGTAPILIADLPIGKYRMRVSLPGFISKEVELYADDRAPMKVDVSLASDSATLLLDSEPRGAAVAINGISTGKTTPCTLSRIPAGDTVLELALADYRPYKQTLKLVAGREETISAVLDPVPSGLKLVSIPEGARMYVNNEFRGESPLDLEDLEPGEYRVRAELKGYEPLARTVTIRQASDLVEEFRLEANSGSFELTTEPAGVKVFIDGEDSGITAAPEDETDRVSDPLRVDLLPIGEHNVQLTKKGYFEKKFAISIERDKTVTLHHKMERRFIPDYEVLTETTVYRGVLIQIDPEGNVKMETRPGVIKEIPADEVKVRRPLRTRKPGGAE